MIDVFKNKIIKFKKPDYVHLDFCHFKNLEDFYIVFVADFKKEPLYVILDVVPNTLELEKKYYENVLFYEKENIVINHVYGFYLKLLVLNSNKTCYIYFSDEYFEDNFFDVFEIIN